MTSWLSLTCSAGATTAAAAYALILLIRRRARTSTVQERVIASVSDQGGRYFQGQSALWMQSGEESPWRPHVRVQSQDRRIRFWRATPQQVVLYDDNGAEIYQYWDDTEEQPGAASNLPALEDIHIRDGDLGELEGRLLEE